MIVNLNNLDSAPDTLPWWRSINDKIEGQQNRLEQFQSNAASHYKQLAAGLNGVLEQYQNLTTYVATIPTTYAQTSEISNFGAATATMVTLVTHLYTVPPNKNWATIVAQFDLSPDTGQSVYMRSIASIGGSNDYITRAYCNGFGGSFAMTSRSFPVVPGSVYAITFEVAYDTVPVNVSPTTKGNCNSFATFTRV